MHNKLNKLTVAVTLVSALLAASQASASGFQVREQSAKVLGNAMAGAAAGAEDVSYMTYNPAAIGNAEGTQLAGGISFIDAQFELTDASASPAGVPAAVVSYDRGGSRQGGEEAWVPSFAFKTDLNERMDFGLSVSAPYGLSTEYDKDWIGRYHAIETDLQTIDIQPTFNYQATDRLDLALGLRAQYADATLSNAIDLGAVGAQANQLPPTAVGKYDGMAEVTGDDWGYGYTLGALFQATEQTRLGISYRSEVDLELEGDVRYRSDNPTGQQVLAGAQAMGRLRDAGGTAELTTPANMNLGIYHEVSDRVALMANAEWTEWSSFDELVVESGGQELSTTEENWNDTWAFSVGANYRLNRQWLLRAGLGVDESPVPDAEHRTPRVPDADRRWATLGATWMPTTDLSVTAGYMRVFGDDGDINQSGAKPENASRGDLSGTYEVDANVFALSVGYRF
ncbi:OmpP1/FadL family transporter [Halomonas halmophila]|uniref:Membrane protein n=1 Tax=Halomonas halmophila TaxID=252 RepID=A0A4Y4EZP8_9GAMM|nr:outer membrane protein transport protein [Halomonas halmophila]GED23482.1 membrane protein [Halomonas halmophila]